MQSANPSTRTVYGLEVGILMLDTTFPRPIGDVGHAATWSVPVCYHVVHGATSREIVRGVDDGHLAGFLAGARALEAMGVRVITTSCGFLAKWQPQLAASVDVPVVSSSLLQVPALARSIWPRTVGILSIDPAALTDRHFDGVGWSRTEIPIAVGGVPSSGHFRDVYLGGRRNADRTRLEAEVVRSAIELAAQDGVGGLVLECTNFSPYAAAIRRAVGMPVFDIMSAVSQVYAAVRPTSFRGRDD